MRVLAAATPKPVEELGFDAESLAAIKGMMARPHGLFLVCGPTGSGKTTTLHSLLGFLNTADIKIWTAEDPIEITQAGLRQVQMNAKIGWTFAAAMRSFMRADPDVIMVGEMRDAETTASRPRSPGTSCSRRCIPTAPRRAWCACSTSAWIPSISPTRCSACWRSAWCASSACGAA
jgi:hypothetical protein